MGQISSPNHHDPHDWQTMANLSRRSEQRCRLGSLPTVAVLAALVIGGQAAAQPVPSRPAVGGTANATHPFPRRVPAPPWDGDFAWINTTRPLSLADVR